MLCWSRGYSSMATNTWLTASDLTYYEFLTTSNSHIIAYTQSVCKYLSIWFYTTGLYSQDPLFYHDSVSTLPSFWEKPTANCVCIRTSFAYSFVCRTFPPAVAGQLPVGKRGWDSMQAEYYKEIICHLQLGVRTTYFVCGTSNFECMSNWANTLTDNDMIFPKLHNNNPVSVKSFDVIRVSQ